MYDEIIKQCKKSRLFVFISTCVILIAIANLIGAGFCWKEYDTPSCVTVFCLCIASISVISFAIYCVVYYYCHKEKEVLPEPKPQKRKSQETFVVDNPMA
jgi:hypothetical protein